MGLGFLAPIFLAGLAALAVPVFIHLIQRERREAVEFPSLMFLRRIPYKSMRRQRLRHITLFALRCLALVLLAAAFARPFLDARQASALPSGVGARELVILLDRSWSMGYGDRWTRALGAARRAVDGVTPDDQATLVLFDAGATAVTEPTADRGALRAAIEAARLGAGVTRYAPALKLAQQVLADSDRPRREAVLITDFQRIGWDGREEVRLPPGTTLTNVDVSTGETRDIAVAGVELGRDFTDTEGATAQERVTASARIVNTGADSATGVVVTLELNGRELERKTAMVPAKGATMVAFTPVAIPDGPSRGTVRVAPDALPQDDAFHFVLSRGQALSVLVIDHPEASDGASLYLTRSLAIGDDPPFRATVRRASRLTAADVEGRELVILNDADFPQGEAGRRLADHVRRGGGLVIALGGRVAPQRWSPEALDFLPAPVGAMVDRSADRGATLGTIDRSHPVFELFSAPRSGDWGSARFFRYRPVQLETGAGALARMDDGSVALAERRVGRGRVLVWGSTLDAFWNDLPLQPVFLPFVHQLAKYAAGYAEDRPSLTVGEAVDARVQGPGTNDQEPGTELVVTIPSGERVRISPVDSASSAPRSRALELTEQGFYEVRRADDRAGPARVIAANVDLAEADLTRLDPEELAVAVAGAGDAAGNGASAAPLTVTERESRQALWWWLLASALVLLAVETVLSNRLSRLRR
ncbi:MAG: BatA domain-containing protein [Gemmatimonadota bacterium]|nr:BatA domain-containing protein [Gemmatimonadota bacterium]